MLEQEGLRISKFMRRDKMEAGLFLNKICISILTWRVFSYEDLGFLSSTACRGHQKNSMDTEHHFLTNSLSVVTLKWNILPLNYKKNPQTCRIHFCKRKDDNLLYLFWFFWYLEKYRAELKTHPPKSCYQKRLRKGHEKGNFWILQSPLTIGFRRF